MRDLASHTVRWHVRNGIRRVVTPFRAFLCRLLRPVFQRLDGQLHELDRRQNQFDRDLKAVLGMGWDHVAIARRLAALEDHVEALLAREAGGDLEVTSAGRARSVIRYPGLEGHPGDNEVKQVVDVKVKVN